MTWVIAASSIFGYATLISDIGVRFSDGTTADLLKKVHFVGPVIAVGFAGSVKLGFALTDDLKRRLFLTPEEATVSRWDPLKVAHWWESEATSIFAAGAKEEQQLGCQVLMVGVSPTENLGDAHFPRPYVIRLVSPAFKAAIAKPGLRVSHIGSGSKVVSYKRYLRDLFRAPNFHLQLSMGGPGAWSGVLAHTIGLTIEEKSGSEISPHLHVVTCFRDIATESKNDGGRFPPEGGPPVDFKMPLVASSYPEFLALCQSRGVAAGAAAA